MLKKLKVMIGSLMILPIILSNSIKVNAYDIPPEACYFHVQDRSLGNVYIYVPCNQASNFALTEDDQIVNVGSSAVTGYLSTTDDYTINFRTFYVGRYRNGNNVNYIDLNITQIYEDTNIRFYDKNNLFIDLNYDVIFLSGLILIGGVLCLIYMKR